MWCSTVAYTWQVFNKKSIVEVSVNRGIACMLDEIKTTSNHIIDNEQICQNYDEYFLRYYMLWIVRKLICWQQKQKKIICISAHLCDGPYSKNRLLRVRVRRFFVFYSSLGLSHLAVFAHCLATIFSASSWK